jgi:hypothetical protein
MTKSKKVASRLTVAAYITRKLSDSERSLEEVADVVGFENPAVLQAVLAGTAKLPVQFVFPLAVALNDDPANLMKVLLREYVPELEQALHETQGMAMISRREKVMIDAFRVATNDRDPSVIILENSPVVAVVMG